MHTWDCKTIDSFHLFLPLGSVLRINLTVLLYSFLVFSFILLCQIPSLLSTLRYLYTLSWSNSCISVFYSITMFPVQVSLPFLKVSLAHFSRPNFMPILSLNCFTIFSSPTCSRQFLLYNFRSFIQKRFLIGALAFLIL